MATQPLSPSSIASDLSFVEHEDYLSSDCFSEPGSEGPIGPMIGLGQPHVAPLGRTTIKLPKLNPGHMNIARERQLALNMIGSAQQKMVPSYIANKPPPVGKRSQNRYFNDHHFGNRAATATLDELMEHMSVSVEWKSNFEELARPENQELAEAFRSVKEPTHARSNASQNGTHRAKPSVDWTVLPSEDFSPTLVNWLAAPITIDVVTPMVRDSKAAGGRAKPAKHDETVLVVPLLESPFHRLLIHATCQFYGLLSKSHYNPTQKCKLMRIRRPSKRHRHPGMAVSMSAYLQHCRGLLPVANQDDDVACDDSGFCLVAATEAIAV
ncbi:hypothetical protein DYB30_002328 [Aphanomyces astaci]|uniref:R3H domain-containing protein n=1 Tax=Aphanomyces astaci TaxID=112090 RepID=A0A397E584_APHAT|nr:hypothetical protein DYB34_006533 [Aphanomyces astaci]RHY75868.1 hypothetical protein DYB30_002328 [Aphanomyces astaci]RHZ14256.1 hypothetical protein DYB26_004934 [Aphanomyces astaci]RHZ32610.1 hypothetical protein DYB31_005821 [Aphanomyces astaci]